MKSIQELDHCRKRRIFIATHVPTTGGGGVERFINILSTILTEEGWNVEIVSSNTRNPLCRAIRPFAAWTIGRKIRMDLEREDVTICNNYFSWNLPEANSIVVYHGTEIGRALSTKAVYSRIRNLAVRTVNAHLDRRVGRDRVVIAVSDSAKEEVERHYNVVVDQVIPNAVDTSVFAPTEDKSRHRKRLGFPIDKFLVLCVGAHDARKGSEILRGTVIPCLKGDQHFVMIGRGLESLPGTTILGEVPFDEMREVYMACDAFVMPSYYEGCSFSHLEALSCGLPCVVSPTGLGKDLEANTILGEYVVSCEEPHGYVDCLRRLQNSRSEWLRVSKESRRYAVESHDLRRFRGEYLDVIREVSSQINAPHQ